MRHPFDGIVVSDIEATPAEAPPTRRAALERLFGAAVGFLGVNAAARANQIKATQPVQVKPVPVQPVQPVPPPQATTLAIGEEGGSTRAVGEEGGPVTDAKGEAGGIRPTVVPNTRDLSPEQLKATWGEMGAADQAKGYQALVLMASAKQAVPFLKDNLKAEVVQMDMQRVVQLIKELDDDAFATREKAMADLVKLGPGAIPVLEKQLENMRSIEARMRTEKVLETLKTQPAVVQVQRGLEALILIGSVDSRGLIENLAEGAADAWVTPLAKTALGRMKK